MRSRITFGIIAALAAAAVNLACSGGGGDEFKCATTADCAGHGGGLCDVSTGACVECLPADDTCDPAKHCDAATRTCVDGCRADTGCTDGNLPYCDTAAHACVACLADAQCPLGSLCVDHACAVGCSASHGCPSGQECCGSACVDLATSASNCGACGSACALDHAVPACTDSACTVQTCEDGFADCDATAANGCEVDLLGTVEHCGACGNECSYAGGVPSCVSGTCQMAGCQPGFSDCDQQAGDGCEIHTASDPANCGACNDACAAPANAAASCTSGVCGMGACNAGFGNCDAIAANGCETSTATSLENCGACGNACSPVANGSAQCAAGSCGVGSCNTGYGNCDGIAATGCETNTATSLANCGACGNVCSPVLNGVPACLGGSCGIAACYPGYGNCDGIAATGCETNTATSLVNCGACGTVCPSVANGVPGCAAGTCGIAACNPGFGNCDGLTANGCEVNTTSNAANCGACGTVCPYPPNAAAACSGGTCGLGTCNPGFANCDGVTANGCEVNTTSNAANCGGCGLACGAGEICVSSSCRPSNDNRANAITLTPSTAEVTVTGSTAHATFDGPAFTTGCSAGANVWYRVTVTSPRVLYFDTAGSSYDTAVVIVPYGSTTQVAGSDDAGCTTGGFTTSLQSQVAAYVGVGTYDVAVSGCGAGTFTLHLQQVVPTGYSYFYSVPLAKGLVGRTSTTLVGASASTGTCGGTASGEDARWFVTCGGQASSFSLCRLDPLFASSGTFERTNGTVWYDPSMYVRSAQTGAEVTCNDDGIPATGLDCRGTNSSGVIVDAAQYGSRVPNLTIPRGLGTVVVDERSGGAGMDYSIAYIVR